ncbi:H/ACA RNA-protein complex component Cbf5p [Methanobrevibacter cuticularis]|uniref:H/ACA RNA-protein complex component Cbf5p n=1 Tax=Methanobrevibacter cuticularis TaxID=47311 RepID=A0A166CNF8_9EURY|nr:H/ACA RNA-protein complex component Cbf5p [Methanobrevibacter cuticularis]
MKIRKRYHLKKKKLKEIKKELGEYASIIPNDATVELLETDPTPFVLVNGEPYIILINNKPYPTIKAALANDMGGKKVVVDMGAVKFVTNGADIMSPGIVDADENIIPQDVVLIIEETHRKPLAIGISLIRGKEMVEKTEGKAIKTIHHIGDNIWNLEI